MKRGYVSTTTGQIHYSETGKGKAGEAVLLIHQVSRSGGIFSRLAEVLAPSFRVICMDMPGFGNSDPMPEPFEVSDLVKSVIDLLDGLGVEKVHVSGHHTGATIAVALAVSHPERVASLAPTGFAYLTKEEQSKGVDMERLAGRHKTPVVTELASDGSHLMRFFQRAVSLLWQSQQSRGVTGGLMLPFENLSQDDLNFVHDFILDGMKAYPYGRVTLEAVGRYDNDKCLPLIKAPTLIVQSSGHLEPAILQRAEAACKMIPGSHVATIENGDIHMIYTRAEELGRLFLKFFSDPKGYRS